MEIVEMVLSAVTGVVTVLAVGVSIVVGVPLIQRFKDAVREKRAAEGQAVGPAHQ